MRTETSRPDDGSVTRDPTRGSPGSGARRVARARRRRQRGHRTLPPPGSRRAPEPGFELVLAPDVIGITKSDELGRGLQHPSVPRRRHALIGLGKKSYASFELAHDVGGGVTDPSDHDVAAIREQEPIPSGETAGVVGDHRISKAGILQSIDPPPRSRKSRAFEAATLELTLGRSCKGAWAAPNSGLTKGPFLPKEDIPGYSP